MQYDWIKLVRCNTFFSEMLRMLSRKPSTSLRYHQQNSNKNKANVNANTNTTDTNISINISTLHLRVTGAPAWTTRLPPAGTDSTSGWTGKGEIKRRRENKLGTKGNWSERKRLTSYSHSMFKLNTPLGWQLKSYLWIFIRAWVWEFFIPKIILCTWQVYLPSSIL